MLFFLLQSSLTLLYQKSQQNNAIPSLHLEKDVPPEFQNNERETTQNRLENKYDISTVITAGKEQSGPRTAEYHVSSITIQGNVIFQDQYAFGTGVTAGSGGAIYLAYSSFYVDPSENSQLTLKNNKASIGGGMCIFSSSVLLNKAKFIGNKAYRHGGAVYFQGGKQTENPNLLDTGIRFYCQDKSSFDGNSASEYGGALFFTSVYEVYIDDTFIKNSRASFSGAGIYSVNVDYMRIYSSFFIANKLYDSDPSGEGDKMRSGPKAFASANRPAMATRGGGAIAFISDEKEGFILPRKLYTSFCCFTNNNAGKHAFTFGNGPGHALLLEGALYWTSISDRIYWFEEEKHIAFYRRNTTANDAYGFLYQNLSRDAQGECIEDNQILDDDVKDTGASPSNTIDVEYTGRQDPPTPYTYVATPISRLPQKTTKSRLYNTAITLSENVFPFSFSFKPIPRTVKATPIETPFDTPASTAHSTPHLTPFDTPNLTPTPGTTPWATLHPSRTEDPRWSNPKPIPPDFTGSTTVTKKTTYSEFNTTTYTNSIINQTINGTNFVAEVVVETTMTTMIETEVEVPVELIIEEEPKPKKNILPYIIGGVIGLVGLIVLIVILIWFFVFRNKDEKSSSTSFVEMQEETIMQVEDTSKQLVTHDNPMWTSTTSGIDDPFQQDFEEKNGYFDVKQEANE